MNAPSFESVQAVRNNRIKFQIKKLAVLLVLFVGLFSASFYVVNFLDFGSPKVAPIKTISSADIKGSDANLKRALGSSNASLAGYADWAKANNLTGADVYNADPDGDGLPNYLEYIHGT